MVIFFQCWADTKQGGKQMGSGAWDLQVYEAMLSILYERENTWTEDLKHGEELRNKPAFVCPS